jgi:hypothetical protein
MCGNEGSGDQRQSEDIVEGWEVHDDDNSWKKSFVQV